MSRAYGQYCPIAHALDVVGERWSLLLVRELMQGPLRYSDLAERLPGCSTNMLAARLKALEGGGVVERTTLPPPAAARVYRLTAYGEALRPVLREMAAWGARTLGPPTEGFGPSPGWLPRVLDLVTALGTVAGRYEFRIDDEIAGVVDGDVVGGPVADPDAVVTASGAGFYHLFVDGDWAGIEVEGDRDAVERLVATTSRPAAAAAA